MSEKIEAIDSEKFIAEIKSEIEKNHYVSDVPGFAEVMDESEDRQFDSKYLHTAIESLHMNYKIDPHLIVPGGGFKNKVKRLMCKLTKPVVEFTSEQNSRANINTAEALSMVEAYIIQHEEDTQTIAALKSKICNLEIRLDAFEKKAGTLEEDNQHKERLKL